MTRLSLRKEKCHEMIVNTLRNNHLVELNAELSSSPLMAWFAGNIEVLWIPIYELPHGADDLARQAAAQPYGDHRILRSFVTSTCCQSAFEAG